MCQIGSKEYLASVKYHQHKKIVFITNNLSYYIISLGCSKNLVDSEQLNGNLVTNGFIPAETSDEADLIIINTCGFITSAKEESIEVILDALDQKEQQPPRLKKYLENGKLVDKEFKTRIVAVGCLTERYSKEIQNDIPEIDFIYGIPDQQFIEKLADKMDISLPGIRTGKKISLVHGLSYRYIKIAEGCSNNCSYCAIPLIRGPIRSFSLEEILHDARCAIADGARELIVVGQDICGYSFNEYTLVDVIENLAGIEGAEWIRLLYMHPDHITDDIIDAMKKNSKIVPYVDIPFQHVNKNILKSMGRSGDAQIYVSLVEKLRKQIPGIKIRSTFMVGFPGERNEEFDELVEFIKVVKLDKVGVFMYSPEENTPAVNLVKAVDEKIMIKRYNIVMEIQKAISQENLNQMIGSEVDVLVEEQVDENTYIGRSCFDAPEVDGIFYLTGTGVPLNTIIKASVTDATEYDLIGEIFANNI